MENGQPYPLKGTLQFSDVTVDESTGSITLRALFPNPQHMLLPGMFVRARIDEGTQPDAILVPQQGVTRTPRGDATVLVVNEKTSGITHCRCTAGDWRSLADHGRPQKRRPRHYQRPAKSSPWRHRRGYS